MTNEDFAARVTAMQGTLYRVTCTILREHADREDAVQSFSHRVEYALRRCEKEETKPMKRKTIVAIIVTVLMLALTTTAVAAVLSRTTEFFIDFYGESLREELENGEYVPGGHTTMLDNVTFTLFDAVITDHTTVLA